MADNSNHSQVRVEDVLPVRSRVSWGAIFAGAFVALACSIVLTLLGSAIGLSIGDNVRSGTLGAGAAIWATLTTIASLFLGGWVTTQCAVGENKREAAIHGTIMWGVVMAMVMWLVATGVRTGFNAMLGVSYVGAARNTLEEDWETTARRAGVSQETIDTVRQSLRDAQARTRELTENPDARQAAFNSTAVATWWTLLGTILSLAAAVSGALVGSGPSFQFLMGRIVAPSPFKDRQYANQP